MYKALAFTLSVISHCFIPWSFSFKQPERVAKPPGPHSGLCLSTAGSVPRGCQAHVGHQLFSQISFQMQALHLQPSNQWASLGLLRRPNSRCFSRPALGHSGTCSRGSFQSRNQNLSLPFSSCTFCHEVKPKLPVKVFRGATCPSPSPLTFYLLWSSCFSFCSSNTPIIPSSGHCRCAFTSLGPALCTDAPAKGIPPFHTIQPLSSTGSSSCPRFSLLA